MFRTWPAMILVPGGVRLWLATGAIDMRRGMNRLALQVQENLGRDPHAGDLYIFPPPDDPTGAPAPDRRIAQHRKHRAATRRYSGLPVESYGDVRRSTIQGLPARDPVRSGRIVRPGPEPAPAGLRALRTRR